jgi:glucokinase
MDVRVVAVDVGGTDMKAALADGDANALAFRSHPTPRGPAAIVDAVAALVDEFGGAQAIGLAVPGVVDDARGVAVWSENLDWRDVPFVELVSERCGVPVSLGHDVRTGALAETRIGAARGMSDVVYVSIGTACGARGCLEAIASAAAIARRYTARTGRPAAGAAEVLRAGDPDAHAVWDEALDALAAALDWVASVIAPEAIVIGGGLSRAGAPLFDPLRERMTRRLTFQRVPQVIPAALGDRAGCMGAVLLALDSIRAAT